MRHQLSFVCEGATLAATLDDAPGTTGLLIVSGGNEVRSGAHRGMAMLAQRIAAAGHPVFRFDRRGIGDSEGFNGGYASSGPDIVAAIAAFREAAPQMTRIVAFGNCDAASALLLHQPLALDALILANPWTYEDSVEEAHEPALPPASAIRARYLARLRPAQDALGDFNDEAVAHALYREATAHDASAWFAVGWFAARHPAGARVCRMEPEDHDRLLARTSHLPHVAAAALAKAIGRDSAEKVGTFCGTGFYDSTRVASGSIAMWHDILMTNAPAVAEELRAFKAEVERVYDDLQAGRLDDVAKFLERAREARAELLRGRGL